MCEAMCLTQTSGQFQIAVLGMHEVSPPGSLNDSGPVIQLAMLPKGEAALALRARSDQENVLYHVALFMGG